MDQDVGHQHAQDQSASIPELELRHRRWRVWQAEESGVWCASVRRNLTARQHEAGRVPHLQADTPDDLEALLAEDDAKIPNGENMIPMRVSVWGRTPADVEVALTAAGQGDSRAAWQAVDVARSEEPIDLDDPRSIAVGGTDVWGYAVYPARAQL